MLTFHLILINCAEKQHHSCVVCFYSVMSGLCLLSFGSITMFLKADQLQFNDVNVIVRQNKNNNHLESSMVPKHL